MKKIQCLNPIAACGTELFPADYTFTDQMAEADAVLVRSASMHELELPEGLLAVGRAGAGVNNIPLDECAKKGIVVFNTPGANANAVKELVIAGLLLSARNIPKALSWASSLDENISASVEKGKSQFAGHEIAGKTLGVIGLGAIGRKVAYAAKALGMEVIGYDPYFKGELENVKIYEDIKMILPLCDYVTIHVPASDSTKGMFGKELLTLMKKSAVLLNFSRDKLVKENELIEVLDAGMIAGYVTDFPNDVISGHENVILIPHLGASTSEAEDNCASMAVQQMMDFFENGNIRNSVNFPSADLGPLGDKGRVGIFASASYIDKLMNAEGFSGFKILNRAGGTKGDYGYILLEIDSENVASMMFYGSNPIRIKAFAK